MQRVTVLRGGLLVLLSCTLCSPRSTAKTVVIPRWAVSSNDNKQFLDNGVLSVLPAPVKEDTVSFIDLSTTPPKLAFELQAPGSSNGPPLSVAVTPTESLALVTAPMKLDPANPTKAIPDNRITVIDMKVTPPKVIATVTAGDSPSGISISRDGKLALVANRNAGTLSVLSIAGKVVTNVGTVPVADLAKKPVPESKSTASVAISPDGKLAIATNDGDSRMTLLKIEGTTVTRVKDFWAGIRPYSVDIASNGKFAIVANVGGAQGDVDTVSLIDLEVTAPLTPHVVDTISVGLTPEGMKISPDSTYAVVVLENGTNKGPSFPFYSTKGKMVVVKIEGKTLKRGPEIDIGQWCQGAAFTADSKSILVGCMVSKDVQVFSYDGHTLKDTGTHIALSGGSAAIRTAEP
jgi:DNA-binding beta-propeller fold protein YncE